MSNSGDTGVKSYLDNRVIVITADGKCFVGTLKAFDQATNIVLEACEERVFSTDEGVQVLPVGLYVIRGDNIASIGEVDQDLDSQLELGLIKAAPLKAM